MTFIKLANEWMDRHGHLDEGSRDRYQQIIDTLSPHLGRLPGTKAMRDFANQIAALVTVRRNELAPSTFNLELATLKRILAYGVEIGVLKRNPVEDIKPAKVQKQEEPVPTPEQFAALVKHIRDNEGRDAAYFLEFLAYSGCREGESRSLKWKDVDWNTDRILIGRGGIAKNGREYWLPLFPQLKTLLLEVKYLRQNETDEDLIWGAVKLRYRLDRACEELKLPHYHHHTFRHYFIVQAIKKLGIGRVGLIARFVNHSDGGRLILELYGNHVTDAEVLEAAARM